MCVRARVFERCGREYAPLPMVCIQLALSLFSKYMNNFSLLRPSTSVCVCLCRFFVLFLFSNYLASSYSFASLSFMHVDDLANAKSDNFHKNCETIVCLLVFSHEMRFIRAQHKYNLVAWNEHSHTHTQHTGYNIIAQTQHTVHRHTRSTQYVYIE